MNILRNVINIRKNLVIDKPTPLSISVNITGRCNLKCVFCEKGKTTSQYEIDFQNMKKLIDLSLKCNCPIFISGGEPFLHKQIWNILGYCKNKGKKISIVTNGTVFKNLSSEQYELLNDAISMMMISLDSANSEEHDGIRGVNGIFDNIIKFLNNPLRKNKVCLNCLLTPDIQNVQPMIMFAKEAKCSLNFQPVIFESNFPDLVKVDWKKNIQKTMAFPPEKMEKLRSYDRCAKKLNAITNLPLLMKYINKYFQYANTDKYFLDYILDRFICFIPFQQITIEERGFIVPCVFLAGESSIYDGDVYENWRNMALKYRAILKNGKRFTVCKSCVCHFADNYRSNIIAYPVMNRKHLFWMVKYYIKRLFKGAGIK